MLEYFAICLAFFVAGMSAGGELMIYLHDHKLGRFKPKPTGEELPK